MPNIKIAPGDYLNGDALEREIYGYVYPQAFIIGGLAVDPNFAVEQMRMIKEVWNQTAGKQLHHFILSFSPWESSKITDVRKLEKLAYSVCEYFADTNQIVFGIHDNGRLHVHFVINSVNYLTGKKFTHNNSDDDALAEYIRCFCIPKTLGNIFPIKKIQVYYN